MSIKLHVPTVMSILYNLISIQLNVTKLNSAARQPMEDQGLLASTAGLRFTHVLEHGGESSSKQ